MCSSDLKDPKNPENEGKVFLYKYGKKIHDKILAAMQPEFQDEEPVNVFDLWEGANFKLRMRKVAGYSNYDESVFSDPSSITEDETKLLNIINKRHNLHEFVSPSNFKSYDELKKKLDSVLSGDTFVQRTAEQIAEEFDVKDRKSTRLNSSH